MRLVSVDVIQLNDTIAMPRRNPAPVVGVEDIISDSFDLIQVVDIQHGDNAIGFPTRITGTNLVTDQPVGIRVPAGTILLSPDQDEIVLENVTPPTAP
jgi:hypothetical protein